ncbi:MAG: hypothetical protein IIY44_02195 [Erysipelotrichales bacterium]|nr:hypothetical protein [Erysipelotrichales bacterium]MBQ5542160.1 hypothetical protein [Erysipelotrichales bacterium]
MDKMEFFLAVVVSFIVLLFLFRAAIGYRSYKNSIFPHLYDNYLIDYFYKINVLQDISKSARLKKLIGHHRIVYSTVSDREGKILTQLCNIIHSKGILSIAYMNPGGELHGKDTGNWYVRRDDGEGMKNYKVENPVVHLKEYGEHIRKITDGKTADRVIAVSDSADISHISLQTAKVVPFSKLPEYIRNAEGDYGLNDVEIDEIYEKMGGKLKK